MAISIRGTAGAWTESTSTTATVTLPTHAIGDMLLVRCLRKPFTSPTNITCATSGWAAAGTGFANGSTANGAGVGSMAVQVFWKVATSSTEPSPVVTWGVTAAPGATCAVVYQRAAGESFGTPTGVGGLNSTADTTISDLLTTHIAVTAGDMVDVWGGWCDDSGTPSAVSISQPGVAYTVTSDIPATALDTGTGNDLAADGGYALATSGTSTGAATIAASFGTSEEHICWMTRLRVSTADTAPAEVATATGGAFNASISAKPSAGTSAATGAAYDATVRLGDIAPAEVATATGAAYDATAQVRPTAGTAAATGVAYGVTGQVRPTAGAVAATGAAHDATTMVKPTAGAASAVGTAYDAHVDTDAHVHAPVAEATAAAFDIAADIDTTAGASAATGAAFNVAATLGANAGAAAAIAAAFDATGAIGALTGHASAVGTAYDATVTTSGGTPATLAPAGLGGATGTAYDATVLSSGMSAGGRRRRPYPVSPPVDYEDDEIVALFT